MLRDIFLYDTGQVPVPKEGELYKTVDIAGRIFHLYYGYYEDFEREHHEPMPIYPDLIKHPEYTQEGIPIVTAMQDACPHYRGTADGESCQECAHFLQGEELFGLCGCIENRATQIQLTENNTKTNG